MHMAGTNGEGIKFGSVPLSAMRTIQLATTRLYVGA
jgi:hypothetical protein